MSDGSRHNLYAVPEAIYGTTPTTPALEQIRVKTCTLGLSKDPLESEELRSDRQIADFRLGSNQVGGDITFEMSYGSFDTILESALMGIWEVDQPSAGIDRLRVGVERKPFSFLRHFSDILSADKPFYLYTGCEISTLSLAISANSMITGSMSILGSGQTISIAAPAGATYPPVSTTIPLDAFTGSLKENDITIAVITEIALTLENGLEPRFVVGSKNTIEPKTGRARLSGSVTAYFENSTLVEKFINETESSLEFELPDAAGNLQTYVIPRIVYTGGKPDVTDEGSIMLTMPFQALLDPASSTNFEIQRNPA
jgi:hypothetical protein